MAGGIDDQHGEGFVVWSRVDPAGAGRPWLPRTSGRHRGDPTLGVGFEANVLIGEIVTRARPHVVHVLAVEPGTTSRLET